MQIGHNSAATVKFPGFSGEASVAFDNQGEGNGSGFEAILGALLGDASPENLRAAVNLKAEIGPIDGEIALNTDQIKAALEKLKDALSPIAAAFDALVMPDPQQISKAQAAFAELATSINAHPNRNEMGVQMPMGKFADQLGVLRQAEGAKGPGNLMQLGKLLSGLDTLLSDFAPQPKGEAALMVDSDGQPSADQSKLSLNIHQMMDRLDKLSQKLPETAQAALAQLAGKKGDQLVVAEATKTTTGAGETNPAEKPIAAANTRPDPLAQLLTGESGSQKKALNNSSSSNLITAALESQRGEAGIEIKAERPNPNLEQKLMAENSYQAQRQAASANASQTTQLASELDATETSVDKILNLQRVEQGQQTQIHIDKVAYQQAPQKQINLPGLAFEVVRQIRNGAQRFEIRLDPPEMGKIDVQLEMEGKNVTARLTVERAETLDFLQRDQRALERALQQAGFNTDKANLQFSLKQDQNGSQGQQANQGSGQTDLLSNNEQGAGQIDDSITQNPSLILRGTARPDGLNLWV